MSFFSLSLKVYPRNSSCVSSGMIRKRIIWPLGKMGEGLEWGVHQALVLKFSDVTGQSRKYFKAGKMSRSLASMLAPLAVR